ncbi:MAG: HNH endonuclease [Alcaligenes nematophilus]|uniref:HNH endonuclease n=1 Tax=Alcaligenes TaxID=507 RepID=UPI003D056A28
MAKRPQRPCRLAGCAQLHRNASGYCESHLQYAKKWRKEPKESGRGGRSWRRRRDYILIRDGGLCQCETCQALGSPLPADEVDHVIPISQGGTDAHDNLRAINADCHRKKSQREALAARQVRAGGARNGWGSGSRG